MSLWFRLSNAAPLWLYRCGISATSIAVGITGLFLNACGDGGPAQPAGVPSLTIVSGSGVSDTVEARLSQALLVELRGNTREPEPGAVIRFETRAIDPADPLSESSALVSRNGSATYETAVVDTTDSPGRASVLVALGPRPLEAVVIVTAPDFALSDTARYTVEPGDAVAIHVAPADTAVYVGNTVTLRTVVVDRLENPREDAVVYSASGSAVSISSHVVTGQAVGRATIVARAGPWLDTAFVTVPPQATIAAKTPEAVAIINADGSGYRELTAARYEGFTTDWSPSGAEVAFDGTTGAPLRAVDLAGSERLVTQVGTGWRLYPAYSPDGLWIYHARQGAPWQLYRIRPDGTGDEPVLTGLAVNTVAPSLAPDGSRLVYVVTGGGGNDSLMTLDLATGQQTAINVGGHTPRWSPAGDLIAYVNTTAGNSLEVVTPSGTDRREVGKPGGHYSLGIDWSPDGRWLVARRGGLNAIEIIEVQTGMILPLAFTGAMFGPSWRP